MLFAFFFVHIPYKYEVTNVAKCSVMVKISVG